MYTRRNALLTGAALAVGVSSQTQADDPVHSATSSGLCRHSQSAAQLCLEMSQAAGECTRATAILSDSRLLKFVEVCQDVADICSVTATLLTRQGPNAPAICQACADACNRLSKACDSVQLDGLESSCQTLAIRCRNSCRSMIEKSIDSSS